MRYDSTMRLALFVAFVPLLSPAAALGQPTAVTTFESIGLYWSPAGSAPCDVRYRVGGSAEWSDSVPLWRDARDGECRGSLVHLSSGTEYEVQLSTSGGAMERLTASTWSESFPIGEVVELPERSTDTLVIDRSGSPGAYILFAPAEGSTATIEVDGSTDHAVEISGSYVIVRGVTIRGAGTHGVRIFEPASDVVIEECDISGWGTDESDGFGRDYDSAIYARGAVERVVVQRNRLHDPRSDSNSWGENNSDCSSTATDCHPRGPQAISWFNTLGNHVIRYNEITSDDAHSFNDGLGGGSNFSTEGFPNRDSDIYGNRVSHCWDDAIESEGANRNVRIWGNYLERAYVMVALASTSLGPGYVWRNVFGDSRRDPGDDWETNGRGGFLKTSDNRGGGRIFVFHNTITQPEPFAGGTTLRGCGVGLGWGGPMVNVTTRNNILHVNLDRRDSIYDRDSDPLGDYDYDLHNGRISAAPGAEPNGFAGSPVYGGVPMWALDPSSPGFDVGVRLPGFNDGFMGAGPDVGAVEAGGPELETGVDAYRDRPPDRDGGVGPVPDGGPGGSDGGVLVDGASVLDGGAPPGASDGCGCRLVTPSRSPKMAWLILAVIAMLGRRRAWVSRR